MMDEKQKIYVRFGIQIVSLISLAVALIGMVKGNQMMTSWGIIVASLINGATSFEQWRTTRKLSQLILCIMLFGLCFLFIGSLFMS